MALAFRDSHALQVVLTSGLCPPDVLASAASVGRGADGSLVLAPERPVPEAALRKLRAIGVAIDAVLAAGGRRVQCWAEAVAPERVALDAIPSLLVLVTATADGVIDLAAELVRLGCDRQELMAAGGLGAIRVVDAPTYTAMRALDHDAGLRGFAPDPPNQAAVWTELGYRHPLAGRLRPAPGTLLLLAVDRWLTLPDTGWRGLDAALELAVPGAATALAPARLPARRTVELRLAGGRREPPSLWVLRHGGVAAIDQLLAYLPDTVVERLSFAVTGGEAPTVIVRARSGRHAPPELALAGEAYAPVADMPDIYAPADSIVEPPLRRERLRAIVLGERSDEPSVVWLAALPDRRFRVERIADRAFLPLAEWTEYVLHASAPALVPWMRATELELAGFVSTGLEWASQGDDARSDPPRKRSQPRGARPEADELAPRRPVPPRPATAPAAAPPRTRAPATEVAVDGELAALEASFIELDAPGDAAERIALFERLAHAYARLGRRRDAGLCFARVVWESRTQAPLRLVDWITADGGLAAGDGIDEPGFAGRGSTPGWECGAIDEPGFAGRGSTPGWECGAIDEPGFAGRGSTPGWECGAIDEPGFAGRGSTPGWECGAIDEPGFAGRGSTPGWECGAIDRILAQTSPDTDDVRLIAAGIALAGAPGATITPPLAIGRDPHRVQRWLDDHDGGLDARTLWLSRLGLARLAGGDPLGLAHTRDRILARLAGGLPVEHEFPGFLRFAGRSGALGSAGGDHLTRALDLLVQRVATIQRRRSPLEAPSGVTGAYTTLQLAHGLARVGGRARALAMADDARQALGALRSDPVHAYLEAAFTARIAQTIAGLPPETALPEALVAQLAALDRVARYKVDRLREASRILEPVGRPDAVGAFIDRSDARYPELAALRAITEPRARAAASARLLDVAADHEADRERLVDGVLEVLLELPEAAALPQLVRAAPLIARLPAPRRALRYAAALVVAGHFGRTELVPELLARLAEAIRVAAAPDLERVLHHSLRALRRIGLRREITELLAGAEHALQASGADALQGRLALAAGLAFLGDIGRAAPVFDEARAALAADFQALGDARRDRPRPGMTRPLELTRALAQAYGHAPIGTALAGIAELANHLRDVTDTFGTNSHFCLSVLHFVESLVLGITSDDLALGEAGRRFIEDDEHLLRRRLHRDMGGSS